MTWVRRVFWRLRRVGRARHLDAEWHREIGSHLDEAAEEYVRQGLSPADGRRAALQSFGGVARAQELHRDVRSFVWLAHLWRDLNYAMRVLRRTPAFTAAAIVTLALGIGANTVAFSVVSALILRPLPLPHADELVTIQPGTGTNMSFPNYRDLRDRNDAFSGVAAYRIAMLGVETPGGSERTWGYLATGNYFEVLGATPRLGRFFGPEEDQVRGGSPFAVLSYACWQGRFGGDPGIVGRSIRLNGRAYSVIGVASEGFQGTELFYWPEVWLPMSMQAQVESFPWLDERASSNSTVVGRRKRGLTDQEVEARLAPVAAALAKEYPRWNEGLKFKVSRPGLMGDAGRRPVAAFTTGVLALACLVLLAACVNVAGLLAARTTDRHKEIAVRMSLGAGRGRIARQLVTESIVLASIGGAAACALAMLLLRLLSQWRAPLGFPVQFNVTPDWRVFLFASVASILSGLIFGVAPAHRACQSDPNSILKGIPAAHHRTWAFRDLLLPVQVTLCCLLIMSSLVSLRGLQRAIALPLGFDPDRVVVAGFDLGLSRYEKARARAFQRAAVDALARVPGVDVAAYANSVPLSIDQSNNSVAPEEAADFRPSARIPTSSYQVSPGYFRAMGTRLSSGREFSWQDDESAAPVAIINETLARRLFGRTDVVGRRFRAPHLTEIVGVVQDGKYVSLTEAPRAAVFRAATQAYNGTSVLIARTSSAEPTIAAEMRRILARGDAAVAIYGVGSLNQLLGFAYFPARAATIVLSVFGILAIVLAATGIYGIAAYAVSRRRREIGIRLAIGAQPGQILKVVLGRTTVLLVAGSIAGFALGLAAGPLLARIVYQASPYDPVVMASVLAAMATVGLVAAGPAARALRVDPVHALRQE